MRQWFIYNMRVKNVWHNVSRAEYPETQERHTSSVHNLLLQGYLQYKSWCRKHQNSHPRQLNNFIFIVLFLPYLILLFTGCPKKHGNLVTNWISSLLWISFVIANFKSHNIIMSARVYFLKRVKDCKDWSIISPQDEQWRRTSLLWLTYLYTAIFLFY